MMSGYSKRLRQFVAKIEELSLKDIKSRLAGYLIENSTEENGVVTCRLVYSKKELASFLGTIPETLSRALAVPETEEAHYRERQHHHHPRSGKTEDVCGIIRERCLSL